jgi:hypothetical protein
VLPLVLVCGFLLGAMVMTFQFISSSDYKAMARLVRSTQASLIADVAADEMAMQLATASYGPSPTTPPPPWLTTILSALGNGNAAKLTARPDLNLPVEQMTATRAAADRTGGLVRLTRIAGRAGPFQYTIPAGASTMPYKEAAFSDAPVRAQDVQGPVSVELTFEGKGSGPFSFGQVYARGQMLHVIDTSPPAEPFVAFSFLPPPTRDYAMQDMQSPGKLTLDPAGTGRVMLRGPLIYVAEDTTPRLPGKNWSGASDKPQEAPAVFPDPQWTGGLATIGGPRTLVHPEGSDDELSALFGEIAQALENTSGGNMAPQRPSTESSLSHLRTNTSYKFHIRIQDRVTVSLPLGITKDVDVDFEDDFPLPPFDVQLPGLSMVLASGLTGGTPGYDTIDKSPAAVFPAGGFAYGPLDKGASQLALRQAMPAKDKPYQTFRAGTSKVGGGASAFAPTDLAEGDVVLPEPIPQSSGNPQENVGLVGLYGLATFDSRTLLRVPILEFAKFMIQWFIDEFMDAALETKKAEILQKIRDKYPAAGLVPDFLLWPIVKDTAKKVAKSQRESIAQQMLDNLRLRLDMEILGRRFRVEGGYPTIASPPSGLREGDVAAALTGRKALLAHFGSWFTSADFWKGADARAMEPRLRDSIRNAVKDLNGKDFDSEIYPLLKRVITSPNPPDLSDFGDLSGLAPETQEIVNFVGGKNGERLMRHTRIAGDPTNLGELLNDANGVKGIEALELAVGKRPDGAFGDYAKGGGPQGVDVGQLSRFTSRGYFPPKYREWERIATRTYNDMQEYLNAEAPGGQVLELRGAVLIRKMDYAGANAINYKGRGIIICGTEKADKQAKLACDVGQSGAAAGDWLILVHRVKPELLATGKPPPLLLGKKFTGTVYSDSGVAGPGGDKVEVSGNLVTGLLNRNGAQNSALTVTYNPGGLAWGNDDITKRWTAELAGEVTSMQPEP